MRLRSTDPRSALLLLAAAFSLAGCRGSDDAIVVSRQDDGPIAAKGRSTLARRNAYSVSPRGGTPPTGPGDRYNRCERIWCLTHGENFFIDHYMSDHTGWIIHDDLAGDIFVAKGRIEGPEFPHASKSALRLCGSHVHPYILGKGGGPVRDGYFTYSLGYNRAHFWSYGTRLDPCCINGLGSDFLHARIGRRARLSDLKEYRAHPEIGWQKPFSVSAPPR